MRSTQALLPGATIESTRLLAPRRALSAYQAAVGLAPPGIESVPLAAAFGRILAADAVARGEFPAQARSTMDGIGLPGCPASSLTILEAVCAPLVRAMTGERGARPAFVPAVAGADFSGRAGWTTYAPAELRRAAVGERAYPLPLRSAHTSLLARASGHVVLTEDRWEIAGGAPLEVVRFAGAAR